MNGLSDVQDDVSIALRRRAEAQSPVGSIASDQVPTHSKQRTRRFCIVGGPIETKSLLGGLGDKARGLLNPKSTRLEVVHPECHRYTGILDPSSNGLQVRLHLISSPRNRITKCLQDCCVVDPYGHGLFPSRSIHFPALRDRTRHVLPCQLLPWHNRRESGNVASWTTLSSRNGWPKPGAGQAPRRPLPAP